MGEEFRIKPGEQIFKDAGTTRSFRIKPSSTSTEPVFTASGDVEYTIVKVSTSPAAWKLTATVEKGWCEETLREGPNFEEQYLGQQCMAGKPGPRQAVRESRTVH